MTMYNRNGILYIRFNDKRISTGLKDTPQNRKMVMSYHQNDKFFNKFNVNKNVPTVLELCEIVLEEKYKTLKKTTMRTYESIFKCKIVPFFKKKRINEIRPKTIKAFYETFTDGSTLGICIAILKEVFESAIIDEYIDTTPLVVKRPRFKSEYKIQPFELDEINCILNHASENKPIRNLLGVAFYTGMRTGEIIGLKWEDVNFKNFTISVNRTITVGYIQSPKTPSSQRVIDMLPQTEKFLLSQRQITGLSEYVFLSPRGNHYNSSACLHTTWKNILKKARLSYRSIYQTRHTFASNMLSNGEELMWVSAMLGHKSANVTLTKYSTYLRRQRERKSTFLDYENTKMAQGV